MSLAKGWEKALLTVIGAPVTQENIQYLDAWQTREGGGTANTANNNPLNTTQPEPGSVNYNTGQPGTGVQSYDQATTGIVATAKTLTNGLYPDILQALHSGSPYAYQAAHASAIGPQLLKWSGNSYTAIGSSSSSSAGGSSNGLLGGSTANSGGPFGIGKGIVQPTEGAISGAGSAIGAATSGVKDVGSFLARIGNVNFLYRAGEVTLGGLLTLMGLYLLAKQVGLAPSVPVPAIPIPGSDSRQEADRLATAFETGQRQGQQELARRAGRRSGLGQRTNPRESGASQLARRTRERRERAAREFENTPVPF